MATDKPMPGKKKLGNYFTKPSPITYLSSGCTLFDCALGNGYPFGRIINLVGNKAAGKTSLGIEACANFSKMFPEGKIWYCEAEAAFSMEFAENIGLPIEQVEFVDNCVTVEDLFEDLETKLNELDGKTPSIYLVDSLDALSDRSEIDREIDKGSYGAAKSKILSQLFRRLVKKIEEKQMLLVIISQVRDNISAMAFGEKHTRSGGRALDFYASQIIWITDIQALKKTKNKVERRIGNVVRAKIKKNKVGNSYRDVDFPIYYNYGVEDIEAGANWLDDIGKIDLLGVKDIKEYLKKVSGMSDEEYNQERIALGNIVKEQWKIVEKGFAPTRKKYN